MLECLVEHAGDRLLSLGCYRDKALFACQRCSVNQFQNVESL